MMFRPLLLLLVMMTGMSNGRAEVHYPRPGKVEVVLEKKTPDDRLKGTLRIINPGEMSWLIQAWSEDAEGGRYSLVYPPLARLEPGSNRDFTLYPGSEAEAGKLKWFLVKLIPPGRERETQPAGYTGDIPAEDCQGDPGRRDPGCIIPEGRGLIRMQRMIKKAVCGGVLFFTLSGVVNALDFADSRDYTVRVTISEPVCELTSNMPQSIDFGDFYAFDVVTGSVKGKSDVEFKFEGCEAVKKLNVKFTPPAGNHQSTDILNGYISNKEGDGYAKGIAVKLTDDSGKDIPLDINWAAVTPGDKKQYDLSFKINARVVPVERTGAGITPGLLQTSASMEITYEK